MILGPRTLSQGLRWGATASSEAQEFIVAPDRIKTLPIGRCVFSMKTENVCRVVKIPLKKRELPAPVPPARKAMPAPVAAAPTPAPVEPTEAPRWDRLERGFKFKPEAAPAPKETSI